MSTLQKSIHLFYKPIHCFVYAQDLKRSASVEYILYFGRELIKGVYQ